MNIYVASSWRNLFQPEVVAQLRKAGHTVYDFRNPEPQSGFSWAEIDPKWQYWTTAAFAEALETPRAREGFDSDMNALRACDVVVLVRPCGASAHLEAGWAVGAGKRLLVYQPEAARHEPELMYRMAGPGPEIIYGSIRGILVALER